MASITFEGFNLQTDNYIISEVIFRGGPERQLTGQKITRRPGIAYTEQEFGERSITLAGAILGNSATDLQDKIDDLHKNVTRVRSGSLTIDSRSIEAVVSSVAIEDAHYNQTYVPFTMDLATTEPFFKGEQLTVSFGTLSAGTSTGTYNVTISGSVFAEPVITYIAPAGGGQTTVSGIIIEYVTTAERITWSGTGGVTTLAYGSSVQFDWINQYILEDSTRKEPSGVFCRWEPGDTQFTVTWSGTAPGGELQMSYQPRYI